MNRFKIITLVCAFAVLVPCLVFALPGAHDPKSGLGYKCNSCHNSGTTYGEADATYSSNVCLRCHSVGGAVAPKSKFTFEIEDYSNPYKTTNNTRANAYQTSHKWFGSVTSAKAKSAGVMSPIDTTANGLNKSNFPKGALFCNRCHNVHGSTGPQSTAYPYLRVPNDTDQMCLNCHRLLNTKDQTLGTHPVNVSYSSATAKAKIANGTLLASPVVNAANPTGQVKLIKGLVICSTCHGVHNTDSRTSTLDPYSSNQTFGQLSSSKGYLLRVDARGKSADATNICTNCHAKKFAHNKNSQNVQCNDCHSGHVMYDAAAVTTAEKLPNVALVRRYLQYSTTGRVNKRIFYRYTGAANKEFYNATGFGVCQSCHNPPSVDPNNHYNLNGTFPNSSHLICNSCHTHENISGSFSYGVGSNCVSACHGSPPVNDNTAGFGSKNPGYSNYSEASTPHASHASGTGYYYNYACAQCHKGSDPAMPIIDYAQVFKNVTGHGIIPGSAASYTHVVGSPSTCNTVYCHSNGNGSYINGQNAVKWGTHKKDTIIGKANECTTCHDVSHIAPAPTGSHAKHVFSSLSGVGGKGYGCASCHAATVSDNTTLLSRLNSTHVNGVKDVQYSQLPPAVGTACSAIYCHSNGKGTYSGTTPVWGTPSTGACETCHNVASPPIGTNGGINAHFTHVSSVSRKAWGPGFTGAATVQCAFCHTYTGDLDATHVNGTVDAPPSNCTNQCHRNGTPTWTDASRLACQSCHDLNVSYDSRPGFNNISAPRKVMATFTAQGHGNYGTPSKYVCTDCHDQNSKHISGKRGDSNRLGAAYEAAQNNLCSSCHSNAGVVTPVGRRISVSHVTTLGGAGNSLCSTCHDVHGTGNYASVVSSIKYNLLSSAVVFSKPSSARGFINTTTRRGLCQVCHTVTNHFRRGVIEPANGFNGAGTDHSGFVATQNCLTCHAHINATFSFKPSGGICNSCHGYPPVPNMGTMGHQNNYSTARLQNYSGGGGVHALPGHLPVTIKMTNGWNADCKKCHYDSTQHTMNTSLWSAGNSTATRKTNISPLVDPQYKFNTTKTLDNSRYVKATSANSGACWNVSCHFQPTPRWGADK